MLRIPPFRSTSVLRSYVSKLSIPHDLSGYVEISEALVRAGKNPNTILYGNWFEPAVPEEGTPQEDSDMEASERAIPGQRVKVPTYQHDSGSPQQRSPSTDMLDGTRGVRTWKTAWGSHRS